MVAGSTAPSASAIPLSQSVTAMRMSLPPRVLSLLNTFIRSLEPSVFSIHRPRMSRVLSGWTPKARYMALLRAIASSRILMRGASKSTGYMGSATALGAWLQASTLQSRDTCRRSPVLCQDSSVRRRRQNCQSSLDYEFTPLQRQPS